MYIKLKIIVQHIVLTFGEGVWPHDPSVNLSLDFQILVLLFYTQI